MGDCHIYDHATSRVFINGPHATHFDTLENFPIQVVKYNCFNES